MLSDKHLKKHLKEWTRDWQFFDNAHGFTINTLSAVTKEDPARIGKLLHAMRQFTPYWCTTVRGYVWDYRPGRPTRNCSYDPWDGWERKGKRRDPDDDDYYDDDEPPYGPKRPAVVQYAVQKAYEFPNTAIHAGEPDDRELENVARLMGWQFPESEMTDENCIHCQYYTCLDIKFSHLRRWRRHYSQHNGWDYSVSPCVQKVCNCIPCDKFRKMSSEKSELLRERYRARGRMDAYREDPDYDEDWDDDYDDKEDL
jgi:hypothetical protein